MACLVKLFSKKCIFESIKLHKYLHSSTILNYKGCIKEYPPTNIIREILFAPIQKEPDKKHRKISVIGAAGNIGQIMTYELILKRLCDEMVLCELEAKKGKMCGIALDLLDGTSFGNHPRMKVCTNCEYTNDSDLIIIVAGIGVKQGASRLDVLKDNADNFRTLIPLLAKLSPNAIMLVISNPVDIMAYAAWRWSGFPVNRVLGTGTSLDTSRFKALLGKKLGISPKAITGYILGEHGQSCFSSWSIVNVAGTRLRDCKECFGLKDDPECWLELEKEVKERANVVKRFKGFTSYAIAMATVELAECILMDKRMVYPISTLCNGVCGLKNLTTFMSLPAVIGNRGVHQLIDLQLDECEKKKLHNTASILENALHSYPWDLDADKKQEKKSQCQ